jgi:hypothetical protein
MKQTQCMRKLQRYSSRTLSYVPTLMTRPWRMKENMWTEQTQSRCIDGRYHKQLTNSWTQSTGKTRNTSPPTPPQKKTSCQFKNYRWHTQILSYGLWSWFYKELNRFRWELIMQDDEISIRLLVRASQFLPWREHWISQHNLHKAYSINTNTQTHTHSTHIYIQSLW